MRSHSSAAPRHSEPAEAQSALKHSRSYVTLADLENVEHQHQGGDLANQNNGHQVTLVQGANQIHGAFQSHHHKDSDALASNPFLEVLPNNVKTKVVSLTPVSPLASPRSGVYNNNSSSSLSSDRRGGKDSSGRRKGRKRHLAYLSIVVLLVAIFYRQDQILRREDAGRTVAETLTNYRPQELWSYSSTLKSLFGGLHLAKEKKGRTPSSSSSEVSFQSHYDKWNATRFAAPLLTEWGERMSPQDVVSLEHHPRPQMRRPGKWMNLNGFWDFKVENIAWNFFPSKLGFEEKILVPFSIESALSGVAKGVGSDKQLVYRRYVNLASPPSATRERYILHFGGVDWKTWVYVNGNLVGTHQGGYDAFHFDITDHLSSSDSKSSSQQEITVVVWDPTEDGSQPHGKQWQNKGSDRLIAPAGMWYTSVTGIWQTVWLETVPETFYIEDVQLIPDIKSGTLTAKVRSVTSTGLMPYIKVTARDGESGIVGTGSGWSGDEVVMKFDDSHTPKLWSLESPFLYNLTVSLHLSGKGEAIDEVESYFAMREISLGRSGDAVQFLLNGKPVFQYGVLDQGWWPDGLYTPPSEEALIFDITKAKEFGFNLIRKHAKVEPDRFYHLCDKLGMLVWQDMPSASGIYNWSPDGAHDFKEGEKTPEAASSFVGELRGVMRTLYNHPSIVSWIPFNEGWGQFDTRDIFAWMQSYDPQRLLWVSGGNDFGIGSAFDRHVYPGPTFVRLEQCRASLLGEFGGNGFAIEGHTWSTGDYETFLNWGYAEVKSLKELEELYQQQMDVLDALVKEGLSAAIFTQLTDVESEFNGIMTYDRKVMKLDPSAMKSYHEKLYSSGSLPKLGLHKNGTGESFSKVKCDWE
mmetsp:Transcript_10564/g.29082  ORF Transcript_10564/g.29082 Transcript_10564/m.29082 type:complete len:862 (-) Transcript_10564:96-2681(-)